MATLPPIVPRFPLPDEEQAAALHITSAYLKLAGTQVASVLLGCPPLDPETTTLAEFGNAMLRGAALCEGLLDLTDHQIER